MFTPKTLSTSEGRPTSALTLTSSEAERLRSEALLMLASSSISITTVRMSPTDWARRSPNSESGPERHSEATA